MYISIIVFHTIYHIYTTNIYHINVYIKSISYIHKMEKYM